MNCKVCDSKDQIEIAGKTFCANCGAANSFIEKDSPSTTNPPNNNPNQSNNQIQTSYQIQPNHPSQTNIAQNPQPSPSLAASTQYNSNLYQTNYTQSNNATTIPNSLNTFSNKPIQNNIQYPATDVQNNNSSVTAPPNNPPITAQVNNQPYNTINPLAVQQATNINPANMPPASSVASTTPPSPGMNTFPTPPTQSANSSIPPQLLQKDSNTKSTENIGNEIGQLSKKDNLVFSDDELDQLANTKSATPNVVNPFADISDSYSDNKPNIRPIDDIKPAPAREINKSNTQIPANPKTVAPSNIQTSQNAISSTQSMMPSIPNPQALTPPQPQPIPQPVNNPITNQNQSKTNLQSNILTQQVEQPKKINKLKKHGGKVASVGLSLAGIILLGIYVWQINYPNLALKVAGSKAGISASMPAYLPNGWKISGDIQANPGSINYKLASAEGDKSISVNQVRSDWDSQALAENYLAPNADKYTALQAEGLTIYVYNNNQASWVNHGTWYRIEGQDHGLSRDQIIKMATSL